MNSTPNMPRRDFILTGATLLIGGNFAGKGEAKEREEENREPEEIEEPILDIHQHTNYSGRADELLVSHQRTMGVTLTVLLPAGSKFGLDAACGGNRSVVSLAEKHPNEFVYFANEVADLPQARRVISEYLEKGGIGIGEQKFRVACDSDYIHRIAQIARDFKVPVLMHFQHNAYNVGIERFHKMLETYPDVNFIGHAQTWWGNIDRNHRQAEMYPSGNVTQGGITDLLLTNYPNMFGDLSAHSGLNSMIRDEEHAREFLARHQDQLLFGSDCNDTQGRGPGCIGAQILAAIRRLAPDKQAERKILYENGKQLLKLG